MRKRRINRTLLELWLGIFALGGIEQFIGMWFVEERGFFTISMWIGIVLALWTVWSMYRGLEKILLLGNHAQKSATFYNILRYVCIVLVFLIILQIEVLNSLVVFMGIMSVKVSGYLQPLTHRICNKLLGEEAKV